MLQSVHVKNLALIEEIEVDFKDGLNILTGETGAGKSIILGSVGLALGGRYTKDIIRQGADYGLVELIFLVGDERTRERLEALDIFPEDGAVVLSRRLMEKRSVSRINGETVTMALLKEAASALIDIHGQHEHQSLLYKKNHLEIVDAFAGESAKAYRSCVKDDYDSYRKYKKELEAAQLDTAQRAKEISFLEFEISEITGAGLLPGEDEELESLYRRMVNGKQIAESSAQAYAYTSEGDGSASENLSRAIRSLSEIAEYDESAGALCGQLEEIDALLNDFNRELSDYSKSCEFSEEEFYETENRLNEINRLKAKYGSTVEEILDYCKEQEKKLEKLEDYENYIDGLNKKCADAERKLESDTDKLTKLRAKQAKVLEGAIGAGLEDLNFPDVKFQIQFGRLKDFTANGRDDVEFLISLNPGQPVKPLADVASGGELSRIMLAIKTVMADRDEIETLIFDEIDVGISGRTAQKVSEKMAVIGRRRQVICITHLAQIAAMADQHYVIEKTVGKMDTRTDIRQLGEEESVEELARLLGGAKITDAVRKNAGEMKELAKQVKLN
ncbi:MAG: DNA repair protein RecN [Lachnospiraceae bacterium]|nr:DNA repair protein RecN [Dorea sp.]MCI9176946.1 DNA repair protein RecN [Lachnospiraceae bacterium]